MTAKRTSRRDFLKTAAAGARRLLLPLPAIAQGAGGRVVVVGGGFARRDLRPFHQADRSRASR